MSNPLQRVAIYFGVRKPDDTGPPPPDDRTLLQVMLGNLIMAAIAGGISALLGSDAVEAIAFGALIYIFFLYMDLRARRKRREGDGSPPAA
ncbi:hypothetical protein AB0L40_17965 [Patulibacter sp. NPDC049589]|uniref:hypothetical protein n=1 Tax=Patulibacter sp. NPDC049589 TaxID=3154731 RepID=UPI0034400996